MADSLRRNVREVADEKAVDRWVPILSGIIWLADIVVCRLDIVILQQGRYSLTAISITGAASFLAGLGLYAVARRTLGKFFSEAVRILPEHKLITSGPYRFIRHPIYLGEILYFISIPVSFGSIYGFIVMLILVPMLIHRIGVEERALISKFGQEYVEYTQKTKKLIPCIY